MDALSDDEKESLKKTLPDLVRETPRARLAETRLKKLMRKAGKEGVEGMWGLLTDIVSDTVRKDPIRRLLVHWETSDDEDGDRHPTSPRLAPGGCRSRPCLRRLKGNRTPADEKFPAEEFLGSMLAAPVVRALAAELALKAVSIKTNAAIGAG